MNAQKISVVVCTLNEEKRLEHCLQTVLMNNPDEVIVVDGGSKDTTLEIARRYNCRVISNDTGKKSSLTRDRQIGINAARNEYIAMIDADHRLSVGDLDSLMADLKKYDFDIVQSQLESFENINYWNRAEEQMWQLTHNIPGPYKYIGVAPALYKKSVFSHVAFDDHITSTIEDTDFMYQLSLFDHLKFGVGHTKIKQLHFGSFKSYFKKFFWYGKGDGEFCYKRPSRMHSMLFHLLVRYPIFYPIKAALKGKFLVVPYYMIQGWVRFFGLVNSMWRLSVKTNRAKSLSTV